MLSNASLLFGGFINLFLVPIVGLKIYCNRHNIMFTLPSVRMAYLYVLITVLNYPFTRLLVIILQKQVPLVIYVEEAKYTVIALISCAVLPFVLEVIEKVLQVEISISLRSSMSMRKKKKTENKNEK